MATIRTLLHRAWVICDSHQKWNKHVERLQNVFKILLYPAHVFGLCVRSFLKSVYESAQQKQKEKAAIAFLKLPYINNNTRAIFQLRTVLKRIRPTLTIRVLYRTALTIQNFFRVKDLTPKNLLSSVVYQVSCKDCNAQYIGKTIRHIEVRLTEHKKSGGLQNTQ